MLKKLKILLPIQSPLSHGLTYFFNHFITHTLGWVEDSDQIDKFTESKAKYQLKPKSYLLALLEEPQLVDCSSHDSLADQQQQIFNPKKYNWDKKIDTQLQ